MARVGAARIFFDVVGSFQAEKFMAETKSGMMAFKNITESILIDTMTAVTDSVMIFADAFQQVLDNTVPLATNVSLARIEFEKFARGIPGVRMEEMQAELRDLGEEFAFTAEQSFQAGARMSQLSGILRSQEAVLAATKGSLQFGFVGGMTSETAAQRMIQLQAQTNFMFGETTEAQYELMSAQQQADLVTTNLNKTITSLNTIENRSAATMENLTFVMNQFASAATLAGDSIEQMAAFSAVLIEAGEQQGKAGRALRMIYARLGSNIKNNNEVLEQYIGSVKDATGTVLPLSDILGRLAEHWPTLSGAVRQNIAQTVAGNDHYIRFIKLMDNYDRSVTLATQAMQGLDDVSEEFALFQEDPSFQLKTLQAELENVREEMGQKLTPIVIGQTKAQIAMTQANTDLISSFLALGNVVGIDEDSIAMAMEMVSMMGNIANTSFERFINIKNMNVALTTQHLILQAISGEEFVKRKGTDNVTAGIGEQNRLLNTQVSIRAHLAGLNREAAFERKQINFLLDTQAKGQSIIEESNRKILDLLRGISFEKLQTLDFEKQQNANLDVVEMRLVDMLRLERERTEEISKQIQLQQAEARFTGFATKGTNLKELANLSRVIRERGEQEAIASAEAFGPMLRLQALAKVGELSESQKKSLAKLEEQVGKTGQAYFDLSKEIEKYISSTIEARGKTEGMTFDKKELELAIRTLTSAEEELGVVSQQLGIHESALADIMKEVQMGTLSLEDAIQQLTIAKAQSAEATRGLTMAENAADLAKFQHNIEQVNLALNSMAIGAGLAAFSSKLLASAIGFDSRESSAAAMMAMHSSMIFTTVQMIQMQAQMMVTTGAAKNMSAALASVGKTAGVTMIAVTAVSLVVGKLVARSQEAAQAEAEHTAAIIATNQALAARTDAEGFADLFESETRSSSEIKSRIDELNEEALAYENLGSAATLATNEKLEGIREERDELTSILRTRQAVALKSMNISQGMLEAAQVALGQGGMAGLASEIGRLEESLSIDGMLGGSAERRLMGEPINAIEEMLFRLLDVQDTFRSMAETDLNTFLDFIDAVNISFDTGIDTIPELVQALDMFSISAADAGTSIEDNITGTIDEAQESLEGFNSALEEFFFGGQISLATGDLLKQVVNKGAENLIQNTELIMTNNFYGLTLPEMVDTISEAVTDQLMERGIVQSSGMSI